jgi:putative transposase
MNEELPVRKTIRLRGFHYAGVCAYFVTICTFEKKLLFGECTYGRMMLNDLGKIVEETWLRTAEMRPDFLPDEQIVMPNHIHATFFLLSPAPKDAEPPNRKLFARVIGGFKSAVTSRIRNLLRDPDFAVWQARSQDRVIRTDEELDRRRQYIRENPFRWSFGKELPLRPVERESTAE